MHLISLQKCLTTRVAEEHLNIFLPMWGHLSIMKNLNICWWSVLSSHWKKRCYFWWKKSCTSWYAEYPTIYRVLYAPSGARFLPSTVGVAKGRIEKSFESWPNLQNLPKDKLHPTRRGRNINIIPPVGEVPFFRAQLAQDFCFAKIPKIWGLLTSPL